MLWWSQQSLSNRGFLHCLSMQACECLSILSANVAEPICQPMATKWKSFYNEVVHSGARLDLYLNFFKQEQSVCIAVEKLRVSWQISCWSWRYKWKFGYLHVRKSTTREIWTTQECMSCIKRYFSHGTVDICFSDELEVVLTWVTPNRREKYIKQLHDIFFKGLSECLKHTDLMPAHGLLQ